MTFSGEDKSQKRPTDTSKQINQQTNENQNPIERIILFILSGTWSWTWSLLTFDFLVLLWLWNCWSRRNEKKEELIWMGMWIDQRLCLLPFFSLPKQSSQLFIIIFLLSFSLSAEPESKTMRWIIINEHVLHIHVTFTLEMKKKKNGDTIVSHRFLRFTFVKGDTDEERRLKRIVHLT